MGCHFLLWGIFSGMELLSLGVSCTGRQVLYHCTTWATTLAESLIWGHHRLIEYPSLQVRPCNRAGSDSGVKSASKHACEELSSPSGCGPCGRMKSAGSGEPRGSFLTDNLTSSTDGVYWMTHPSFIFKTGTSLHK